MQQTNHLHNAMEKASTHTYISRYLMKKCGKSGDSSVSRSIAYHLAHDRFGYRNSVVLSVLRLRLDENGEPIFDTERGKKWYAEMCGKPSSEGGFADIIRFFDTTEQGRKIRGKNRKWQEYCLDLVYGWILEDSFLHFLMKNGIKVSHNGSDAKREIITDGSITTSPDFIIEANGRKRNLELQVSMTNFETNNGVLEFRNDKLIRLRHHKSVFVQLDLVNDTYVLIDTYRDSIKSRVIYHSRFNKIAHDVFFDENGIEPKGISCLVGDLNRCCEVDVSQRSSARLSVTCGTRDDYHRLGRELALIDVICVCGYGIETKTRKNKNGDSAYTSDEILDCKLTLLDMTPNATRVTNPLIDVTGYGQYGKNCPYWNEIKRMICDGVDFDMDEVCSISPAKAKADNLPISVEIKKKVEEIPIGQEEEAVAMDEPDPCEGWA